MHFYDDHYNILKMSVYGVHYWYYGTAKSNTYTAEYHPHHQHQREH